MAARSTVPATVPVIGSSREEVLFWAGVSGPWGFVLGDNGRMRPSVKTYLVDDEGERVFGPGPAELLRRIREYGSLRAAAISMGMAYTKALALVRKAEAGLGSPLTTRVIGGSGGGGSTPTPEADELLACYERWTAACEMAADAQYASAFAPGVAATTHDAADANARLVGVAVLGAGHARRFGANKLAEPLLGEPVIEHTLGCVPPGLPMVVASNSPEVDAICDRRGIERVRPAGSLEQSDSMRVLVAHAKSQGWEACVFVPGDQPLIEQGSLRMMLAVSAANPDAAVRLCWRGRAGSPVLFPANLFNELLGVTGDAGGSSVLNIEGVRTCSVEASWPWELWDIDTPDDLGRCREIIESGLARGGSN